MCVLYAATKNWKPKSVQSRTFHSSNAEIVGQLKNGFENQDPAVRLQADVAARRRRHRRRGHQDPGVGGLFEVGQVLQVVPGRHRAKAAGHKNFPLRVRQLRRVRHCQDLREVRHRRGPRSCHAAR